MKVVTCQCGVMVGGLALLAVLASVPVAAQNQASSGRSSSVGQNDYVPPMTRDGQPDIQGVWQGGGLTIEPGYDGNLGTGFYREFFSTGSADADGVVPPPPVEPPQDDRYLVGGGAETPDRRIPFQPWARVKKEANFAAIYEGAATMDDYDPVSRCLPTGVPRAAYIGIGGYQFFQVPGYVVIFGEWNHQYRIIPLDVRPKLTPGIRLWNGDSRGQWEGHALVIETTNLTDKTWLDHMGSVHSDALHVVERYTPVDADTLRYEVRLEDEKAYAQPWTLTVLLKRNKEELLEYACHEGNGRSMRNYFLSLE